MFSWVKAIRQKWALVKTFKIDRGAYDAKVYYIHCYESNAGNRKIECFLDGNPYDYKLKNRWLPTTELFQTKIYRWLNGRRDPDIPTYNSISEEDTINFLKGKIS